MFGIGGFSGSTRFTVGPYLLEVKATTTGQARLTPLQAETASKKPDDYLLCVVDLRLIQAGAELRAVPSLHQGRPHRGHGCYTRPARNFALWPSVGLVVLPAAVSFRTLRRGGPHRGGRAVGLPRAHRRGGAGGPGQEHLPERRGPGQPQHRPAAGPSQGDGGASWATTRTTPHTSSPSLASATGCRGARRRILLNDDGAPHEWCRLTT